MIRRATGGRTAAVAGLLLAASLAGCGSTAPSPAPSSAPPTAPHLALEPTGKADEPLPPTQFDPRSLPAFSYFTEDGQAGVWSGPIGRPDLATPLVDPIPADAGGYDAAVRFPDGSVVVIFSSGDDTQLLLLRPDADPRLLLDRVGGLTGAAPELGSLVVARTTGLDDGGIWQVWLDGREAVQVLPPVKRPELAMREGLALGPDGVAAAAAACNGQLQGRWPGQEPTRLPLGIPVGFDRAGNLIAHRDCGRGALVQIRRGASDAEELVPSESGYQAIVTPGRGVLAVANPSGLSGKLLLIDLPSGVQHTVPLAGGGWDFTSDTTDRYVVLRRDDGGGAVYRFTWAVHDLVEGWTGYFVVDTYPPVR
jgi:hypothetical protein